MVPARWRTQELQLLGGVAVVTLIGMTMVSSAPLGRLDLEGVWPTLVYLGLLFAVNIWLSVTRFDGDQTLLPLVGLLSGIGLVVVYRLRPDKGNQQLIWLVVGVFAMMAVLLGLRNPSRLRYYKYSWAVLGFALMLAPLTPLGLARNGARNWVGRGPLQFQPSEALKITMVIFLAAYLDTKRTLISRSRYRLFKLNLPPLPYLAPMVFIIGMSLVLVVVQNDFGATMLYLGIFLVMLYVTSSRSFYVWGSLVPFAALSYLAYHLVGHVHSRIDAWLNPWNDPFGGSYQIVQSIFAFISGGIFGTGLGLGHPTYIPEVHTDFVFAAIGEELGLAGAFLVVACFLVFVLRGFRLSLTARDGFQRLLAVGLVTIIGLQALIIIAGTIRLIPLTGITLPFVSYGGSSLLVNYIILGLLLRISATARRTGVSNSTPMATNNVVTNEM